MELEAIWEQVLTTIEPQINEITFKTFVKPLEPVSLQDGCLILKCAAEYIKTLVVNRYLAMIMDVVSQIVGAATEVRVYTGPELEELQQQAQGKKTQPENSSCNLNARYTFETFVVGSNNRFAHAASLAVAEAPAQIYNPLFIYGGVGLGKTHLMHAIGHYAMKEQPNCRVLVITAEEFTNELIEAIHQGTTTAFRNRFRNVDILMVDDIQSIAGRESTQEEFFNTFNSLHQNGKQIVLTSDRPPRDIARLEDRLRSRFEGGLIADIQRPDVDTRVAILRKKAMDDKIKVGDDVLTLIAEHVSSNIRELEGTLNRVVGYSNLMNRPISVEMCRESMRDIFAQKSPRMITSDVVLSTVAEYYSLQVSDIISQSRRREITMPRQIAMFLCREMAHMSLPQIGQAFGGRDHSTVLYSCNLTDKKIKSEIDFANLVEDIRKLIRDGE